MKIEAEIRIKLSPRYGIEVTEPVKIVLEGEFNAIVELLRKVKFDLDVARDLELK